MAKRLKLVFLIWFLALIITGGALGMEPGIAMILSLVPAGLVAFLVKPKKFDAQPSSIDETQPRLADTPEVRDIEPVRGVWEGISWEYDGFAEAHKCSSDTLQGIGVFVTSDSLFKFAEDMQTWKEATTADLSPEARLTAKVALADIQSVQMEPSNQFHGNEPVTQLIQAKGGNRAFLESRHPNLDWNDFGFECKTAKLSMIYVFTREGDRIRLFHTWNRDLAIKWRTQISNRIDAVAHATPEAAKAKDGQPDYM